MPLLTKLDTWKIRALTFMLMMYVVSPILSSHINWYPIIMNFANSSPMTHLHWFNITHNEQSNVYTKKKPARKIVRQRGLSIIQARERGDHGIPFPEVALTILLCLWNMEYLIL
jgi:hypothetical protein